ncbi:MAG: hypothetical protein WBD27_08900 [Pyrinomonadaceae bacterium]
MKHALRVIALLFALPFATNAQFSSGSTGADGALDLLNACGPSNVCHVQIPESGVLNYTTINIPGTPTHRTLRFIRNSRNTPVILLAQGNVTIGGTVDVSADHYSGGLGYVPGPGGFYGGTGGLPGFGPGGGTQSSPHGKWIGPLSLVPIVGGSGGYGATGCNSGGGGGGAIVIASSTSITVTGLLIAYGSSGCGSAGGFGSGGAIRLVANNLTVLGSLSAQNVFSNNVLLYGVVRLEATSLTFTGSSSPAATLSPINPNIVSGAQTQLTIQSVGGFLVPSYAGSRFDTIDLLLPNQIPDPVNVVVSANNIPTGTQVQVGFVSGSPGGTSTSCNLSGSLANSSCTATVSNLNRTGVTYLLATAAFAPPAPLAGFNPKGADHVAQIKLESVLGAKQKYVFLRGDNSVIDTAKVPKEFLLYFGM